ncbi:hypothetical protein FMUND_992 [Fusarium mundagurra]|uniref:Uncharacterized protein n=1 Tax=Fusarium mundagurra TaxID=1567541 RepID=A0A8H5Z456_9HYPO|nr:hypothetical protein FMUND_992 [Fusarium mundagurra]
MTGEKASDNKPTEKVTPEKKATEGENTQETSKDNETTDAQHSDVQSAEDEVVKLSVIRQHLSAEVPDLFFNVFAKEGLGLPSQYCYPSAYDWLKKVIWKFHKKSEKATNDVEGTQSLMTLQFACLRFRCVACRKPCQDAKTMEPMKGHAGRQEGDVEQDTAEPCTHRIMFDCEHSSELAVALPGALSGDGWEVPKEFILTRGGNGRVPSECRKCIIQGHLDRWTTEARQITGYEKLWAMCGLLHGMEYEDPGIITRAKKFTDKLEGRVAENAKVLRKLLEETPEPSFTEEEYRRSGIPRDERAIYRSELEFFIENFNYFVEVEDDEDEESDSIEEEDGRDGDYELPQLKVTPPTPQR